MLLQKNSKALGGVSVQACRQVGRTRTCSPATVKPGQLIPRGCATNACGYRPDSHFANHEAVSGDGNGQGEPEQLACVPGEQLSSRPALTSGSSGVTG